MIISAFLLGNNFKKAGQFKLKVDKVNFESEECNIENHSNLIYSWVAEKIGFKPIVLYVGKTSSNIRKRIKEHEQGFRGKANNGSISGEFKKHVLEYLLENKFIVSVYVRESLPISKKLIEVLKIDMTSISLQLDIYTHHLEEEVYIKLLSQFNAKKLKLPLNNVNVKSVNNIQNFIEDYFETE
jgi:hypothetical protein